MSQVDPATDPQVAFKRAAAVRAVEFVQSGMKLGLGTGSRRSMPRGVSVRCWPAGKAA